MNESRHQPSRCIQNFPLIRSALLGLTVGLTLLSGDLLQAQSPESLSFRTKGGANLGIGFAVTGLLSFDVPGHGAFHIAPRVYDTGSGTWKPPVIVKNFGPAEGKSIQSSAEFQWEGGAKAVVDFAADLVDDRINVKMSWTLEGDAPGHFQADILVPHDMATHLTVQGSGGKNIYENGTSGAAGKTPVAFLDSTDGKTIFTVEAEGYSVGSRNDKDFEQKGVEIRIGPYPSGPKSNLSLFENINFSIVFPK